MDKNSLAMAAQRVFQNNPVIILGSGASIAHGLPGMGELESYFLNNLSIADDEKDAWLLVRTALSNGDHLEQALLDKQLPNSLQDKIVRATWSFIVEHDNALLGRTISGQESFSLSALLQELFRSSQETLHIITTNYDRMAEYACGAAGLIHLTGFYPGYVQTIEGQNQIVLQRNNLHRRTVRIWKVHGSLDWFERKDGDIIGGALLNATMSDDLNPLIVTPGLSKFQRVSQEPFRTIMQSADQALSNANAYLCVGFGFRDEQIEPKIVQRCRKTNVPIAVVTKTLTEEARTFLQTKAGTNYLAVEEAKGGTRVYTNQYPDGIEIAGEDYWSLSGFLTLVK